MCDIYKLETCKMRENQFFSYIPGCYIITPNSFIKDKLRVMKEISTLVYLTRKGLMNYGVQLTGIYYEQPYGTSTSSIGNCLIFPFHLEELENQEINPDYYQPFIFKYLKNFDRNHVFLRKEELNDYILNYIDKYIGELL